MLGHAERLSPRVAAPGLARASAGPLWTIRPHAPIVYQWWCGAAWSGPPGVDPFPGVSRETKMEGNSTWVHRVTAGPQAPGQGHATARQPRAQRRPRTFARVFCDAVGRVLPSSLATDGEPRFVPLSRCTIQIDPLSHTGAHFLALTSWHSLPGTHFLAHGPPGERSIHPAYPSVPTPLPARTTPFHRPTRSSTPPAAQNPTLREPTTNPSAQNGSPSYLCASAPPRALFCLGPADPS